MRRLGFILVASMLLAGCSRGSDPKVYVPIQETAQLQYAYAVNYRSKNELILRDQKDMERLERTREAVRQTFEKVVEYFPNDREVTPLARLDLADMQAKLDQPKWKATKRELKRAIETFQGLRAEYPEFEFVQVKASYDEAMCWKSLGEFEKAQSMFRDVAENYRNNKDQFIRSLAGLAQYHYQQTYVN